MGVGEEYRRLRRMADSSVTFLGGLSDQEVQNQYAHCRALLFPGEEDFGIVPVEAQACGRPVIAFSKGGALETVVGVQGEDVPPERATGVFFAEQSVDSITEAIRTFEAVEQEFSPRFIRSHAEKFDKSQFRDTMSKFIAAKLTEYRALNELPRHRSSTAFNQPVF